MPIRLDVSWGRRSFVFGLFSLFEGPGIEDDDIDDILINFTINELINAPKNMSRTDIIRYL